MAAKKKATSTKKKSSLVENINRRKKAGTSRPRSRSTVSSEAYADMERGWPRTGTTAKAKKKTTPKKKRSR